MLAIGAGGLDVALAMSGETFETAMPEIFGIKLVGKLPDWVSAKDVILEMLRRHGVSGGIGKIIEYYGPGLADLTAMDRHVIANMGAELGATTTVFPSDHEVKRFLESEGRGADWAELTADSDCAYGFHDEIDLSTLVPLIAKPSSPGNVVPVSEVEGEDIYQVYIGSSANPGWRDFAVVSDIVRGKVVPPTVSFDINPSSRQTLEALIADGRLGAMVAAGARIHQAGCNGCIGMGQAPATGQNSLRTVPRNFPGRSGTREDSVFLCSPETAAASALTGKITDPRSLDMPCPQLRYPEKTLVTKTMIDAPPQPDESRSVVVVKGPNIKSLPVFDPLPDTLELPVILKMGDNISTDEIMPPGAKVLPFRSNIQKIDDFSFERIDTSYVEHARAVRSTTGHSVMAGDNYGQGSSREHAAVAPRNLGLRLVLAKGFARIHRQNLVNYGVLPLVFAEPKDYEHLEQGDVLIARDLHQTLASGGKVILEVEGKGAISTRHALTEKQIAVILEGGLINWRRKSLAAEA
jgi:aconitate hydratase